MEWSRRRWHGAESMPAAAGRCKPRGRSHTPPKKSSRSCAMRGGRLAKTWFFRKQVFPRRRWGQMGVGFDVTARDDAGDGGTVQASLRHSTATAMRDAYLVMKILDSKADPALHPALQYCRPAGRSFRNRQVAFGPMALPRAIGSETLNPCLPLFLL